MKIIGFVHSNGEGRKANGEWEMVLKGDSCLLNGRKPFFVPDWSQEIGVTPCMILRVSRLGKEIALKFADRYYDAIAPGEDFVAMDVLREAKAAGKPWTKALAFDYSLAIGEWVTGYGLRVTGDYVLSPEEAIVEASKVMTIRQGDLIYIQADCEPRRVQKEEVLRVEIEGEEKLYCKIK
jgi:2-keto-4-pentenoate hydratase/2-oxohepta-3-ene-1,7-dioic acid hydratase in catechol pathway